MNIVLKTILTSCIVLYSTNNTCIAATDATDSDVNVPDRITLTPQTYTCDTDLSAGSSEDVSVNCNSDKGLNDECDDDQVVTGFSYVTGTERVCWWDDGSCTDACDFIYGCYTKTTYSCTMTCTDFDVSCEWEDATDSSAAESAASAAEEAATEAAQELIDDLNNAFSW